MRILKGLPPILPKRPRILILGSMPSAHSLAAKQYYAHPQNAFWPLLMQLLNVTPPPANYAERVACLCRAKIAVWDVLAACERPGSLDVAIVKDSEQANPIAALLARESSIAAVAFNGGKARQCFGRHVQLLKNLRPEILLLPSTSPANATMTRAQKLAAWRQVSAFLPPPL